ncbi:nSTAND1 domain-containing NTPase [Nocardia pseudobrasiliensis]|uniref:WD40 repeat protein n=1 Tax=Nocardia pseudobrasiliensis TaxID=45979 RepID=A0A370HZV3_9NOCA|nr:TIR domain-containing protein [Nocardia pseudobrasiliensis]RDI63471.1 WD40 repeat protein [Nocardia pseudobrasiliensis]
MARVFISHASADREWAAEIRGWLVADGHEVFLDLHPVDGLIVGEEWERALYRRLRWADAVVCVITATYLQSVWCAAEVGIAKANGARLLPVRVAADITHPLLKSLQQSNAAADPAVAREKLAVALRRLDMGGGVGWSDDLPPYPGLEAFGTDRRRVFFGRTREAAEVAELLRKPATRTEPAIQLVIGPSGCGKSSLVRAGVIPLIAEEPLWLPLEPIVPGADPIGALARSLAPALARTDPQHPPRSLRERLTGTGLRDIAIDILNAEQAGVECKLLLVIDQFEQLLRRTPPRDRAEFVDLLLPAVGGPIQILATLRPEFLDQLGTDPALARIATRTHPLRPLRTDALREVIQEPARVAGLTIEDGLVEALLADTDSGDALPLLAFTLQQLAYGLRRGDRLTRDRYDEIGGVRGALERQAETALAEARAATGHSDAEIVAMLLRLVTVDEYGVPTRDRVARAELSESARKVFDAFVTHRLLVVAEEDGRIVVTAAHEAFPRNWTRLREAIAAESTALRARRAVEIAAADWERDRKPARLWERDRLAVAAADLGARVRLWRLGATRVEISARARTFLERGYRRDRLRRGRATAVLSALLCAALVAAFVAIVQQRQAVARQHTAVAGKLLAQANQLRPVDPRTAIRLGVAADRIDPGNETRQWLINTLSTTRYAGTIDDIAKNVLRLSFSPDGRTIAVQHDGGTIELWAVSDSGRSRRLSELTGVSNISAIAFTPDGTTLLTGSGQDLNARDARLGYSVSAEPRYDPFSMDGLIQWDLTDPAHPRTKAHPALDISPKLRFDFAPATMLALGTEYQQPTALWDLADPDHPMPVATLLPPEQTLEVAEFSPDGRLLVTGTRAATTLWDVTDRHSPRPIGRLDLPPRAIAQHIAFSPDGRRMAVSVFPTGVARWDVTDPAHPRAEPAFDSGGTAWPVFARSGNMVAVAAEFGNRVTLYRFGETGDDVETISDLVGRTGATTAIAFSANGIIAVGGPDGRTILWTTDTRAQPQPIGEQVSGQVDRIVAENGIATAAGLIATGGKNGRVDLWDTGQSDTPVHTASFDTEHFDFSDNDIRISCVALSPDGTTLAVGGIDRTVSLWDVTDRRRPRRLGAPLTGLDGIVRTLAFTPDGTRLAAGSDLNSLVWNIETRDAPRRLGRGVYQVQMRQVYVTASGRILGIGWQHEHKGLSFWDFTDSDNPIRLGEIAVPMSASVAYSPVTGVLVAVEKNVAQFWDVRDPARGTRVGNAVQSNFGLISPRFDATGTVLATSGNGRVQMWLVTDPAHPTPVGEPRDAGAGDIVAATFTADSNRLITGHDLGVSRTVAKVAMWDLRRLYELRRDPADTGCRTVGSGLDPDTWRQYIQELPYRDTCR